MIPILMLTSSKAPTSPTNRSRGGKASRRSSPCSMLGRGGACAIIKVDGERVRGQEYTVLLSGGALAGESFRKDGSDLRVLLREAIEFHLAKVSNTST